MRSASAFVVGLLLTMAACTAPDTGIQASSSKLNSPTGGFVSVKELSNDVWKKVVLGKMEPYPVLAHLAGISGEVLSIVLIDRSGGIVAVRPITGPAQLYPHAERFLRTLRFPSNLSEGNGPWGLRVLMRYDKDGLIGVGVPGVAFEMKKVGIQSGGRFRRIS
jgi:hypothetical protein